MRLPDRMLGVGRPAPYVGCRVAVTVCRGYGDVT